jgi:hypothetical protein
LLSTRAMAAVVTAPHGAEPDIDDEILRSHLVRHARSAIDWSMASTESPRRPREPAHSNTLTQASVALRPVAARGAQRIFV